MLGFARGLGIFVTVLILPVVVLAGLNAMTPSSPARVEALVILVMSILVIAGYVVAWSERAGGAVIVIAGVGLGWSMYVWSTSFGSFLGLILAFLVVLSGAMFWMCPRRGSSLSPQPPVKGALVDRYGTRPD